MGRVIIPRGPRVTLSLQEKMDIIRDVARGEPYDNIKKRYGLKHSSTISMIISRQDHYKQAYSNNPNGDFHRKSQKRAALILNEHQNQQQNQLEDIDTDFTHGKNKNFKFKYENQSLIVISFFRMLRRSQ